MAVALDLVFLGAPGATLLYTGFWMPRSDIDPEYHLRLVVWMLGGVVVMFGFIVLRDIHPGVSVDWSTGTQAIALTLGSIGGLLVGIQETRTTIRTAQLTERTELLVARERELERKNDRLEEFTSVVSHHLRNPLNVAQGYLELARADAENEHLDTVRDAHDRMGRLIDDLLTDPDAVAELVERPVAEFGGLDHLVTSAGGPPAKPFLQTTDEEWYDAFDLLVMSVVRTVRAAAPHLRADGGGTIVTIASITVKEPKPNLVLSNAVRSGVVGLEKTLSQEFAPEIRTNAVLPGTHETPRVEELVDQGVERGDYDSYDDGLEEWADRIPIGRLGDPMELGRTVASSPRRSRRTSRASRSRSTAGRVRRRSEPRRSRESRGVDPWDPG